MMVKVLVYGYATGIFSSRKLATKLVEDIAFRLLAAGSNALLRHKLLADPVGASVPGQVTDFSCARFRS